MEPNAALTRSRVDVVEDTIPGENLDLAVIHLNRARDDDLALGLGEDLPDAGIETEKPPRLAELVEHGAEDLAV